MKRTPKKLAALLGLVSTATARSLGAEEADLLTKALTDYDQQRRQLGSILAKNLPAEIARYEEVQGEMNEKAIDDARRIATLESRVKEGRRAAARIRSLHSRYRSALTDEFDCCAHCNQLTANLVPYPCETILALGEADVQLAIAYDSCPGVELKPNPCRCPCYGCKHNCGAHNPALDEEGDVR